MGLTLLRGARRRIQIAKDKHKRLGDRADEHGIIRPKNGILPVTTSIARRGALPALLALELVRQHYAPHVDPSTLAAGVPLLLGPKINFGRRYEDLGAMLQADANQPESQPWALFDTQTYPQAGVSTQGGLLAFFNNSAAANNSDPTLSNFPTGKLDADYYFEQHRIHTIIQALPTRSTATTTAGAANDVEILHKSARGILLGKVRGKDYYGFPLAYFGRPGGPMPAIAMSGSGTAADNSLQFGEQAENGGFPVVGNIVLSPANQWYGWMQFVPSTAISAATPLVYSMMGILHRPVA